MKYIKALATVLFLGSFLGLNAQVKAKVSGEIFNGNGDSIFVSRIVGNKYVDHLKGKLDKKGAFVLEGKIPAPDYYVFRLGNQSINIILRKDSEIHAVS